MIVIIGTTKSHLGHLQTDVSPDGVGQVSLADKELVVVGVEEGRELVQHGAVLVILVLLRVEHLLLQLPHNVDHVLPVPGEAALAAAPPLTVQTGVCREDGASTLLTEAGAQVGPQLGGVRAARARAVEEPILLDVGPPPHVAFNDKGTIVKCFMNKIARY